MINRLLTYFVLTVLAVSALAIMADMKLTGQTNFAEAAVRSTVVVPPHDSSDLKTVRAKVTAYCACSTCCEDQSDGRTAWWRGVSKGFADQPGCAVAPDAIPYGTWLHIPGAGWRQADDTGGAMRQSWHTGIIHIDLRFNSHKEAQAWGVQHIEVQIHRP